MLASEQLWELAMWRGRWFERISRVALLAFVLTLSVGAAWHQVIAHPCHHPQGEGVVVAASEHDDHPCVICHLASNYAGAVLATGMAWLVPTAPPAIEAHCLRHTWTAYRPHLARAPPSAA